MMLKTLVATLCVVVMPGLTPGIACAQDYPWLLRFALESGGEDLAEVQFSNGVNDKLEAGGLLHFEAGRRFSLMPDNPAFQTEISAGFKSDSINATNGDMSFRRVTLNAMQYYQIKDRFRAGGGITYHLNPTFKVDMLGANGKLEADDALGFMLGVEYLPSERSSIGVRITGIDYEFEDSEPFSGNSIGVYAGYYL